MNQLIFVLRVSEAILVFCLKLLFFSFAVCLLVFILLVYGISTYVIQVCKIIESESVCYIFIDFSACFCLLLSDWTHRTIDIHVFLSMFLKIDICSIRNGVKRRSGNSREQTPRSNEKQVYFRRQ